MGVHNVERQQKKIDDHIAHMTHKLPAPMPHAHKLWAMWAIANGLPTLPTRHGCVAACHDCVALAWA